ncbi:hypothetical protein M408DRAFT_332087 [Serendipita vermifera MAFF 305830]|uniref:Major facilitator superfamily (MFS) profile domain-containing protein n=1 Tax=Serendipita vermifera MAFF 305830 TaxID=933852 RepID=A0A0C3AGV4_SERVB|nr:hypothetical protein M408DRAFT_332087 [Serendipita vermifera MAFF 305830]
MDPPSEATPLLAEQEAGPQQRVRVSQTVISRLWKRYDSLSTVVRVTPILFLSALSDGLPQLTIVDIMKRVLCAVWYIKNSPDEIPEDGAIPDEKCQTPGPVAWFSAFMVIQALLLAFGGFVITSLVAQFGTRVGRKPILLLLLMGQIVAMASFTAALFVPNDVGALALLVVWLVISSFASYVPVLFTCNLMVVDTAESDARTAALSFTMGAVAAGGIPSFALGGLIYRLSGPRTLCLITLGILMLTFILSSSAFVRETFGGNKLIAAREDRQERRRQARERSLERWVSDEGDATRGPRRVVRKSYEAVHAIFDPVLRLGPTIKEDGTRNLRLTWLGIAYFFAAMGTGYLAPALISYMTIVLHQDPAENGLAMTAVSIFQTLSLAVFFPFAATKGRSLYTRMHARTIGQNKHANGQSNGSLAERQSLVPTGQSTDTLQNPSSELSAAHFDVYLLRWCYVVFIPLILGIGYAKNNTQLIALSSLLMLCAGSHPVMQSVAAASVSPIQAGEAIAGVEMVGQIARFASPVMIGSLQSKTILQMPMIMFIVMAAFVFVGGVLTLPIRDEDRYIPPTVASPVQEESDMSEER